MTERQDKILKALIAEFVRTAEPVGSELLTEKYRLPYSPATVRAELAMLEELGFLAQPHTSAGRIPTDQGYRYFVDQTITEEEISKNELMRLKQEILKMQVQYNKLARGTARLLASLSQNLAVAGVIDRDELHEAGLSELIREPEFSEAEPLLEVSRVLDAIEDNFENFTQSVSNRPTVYIGGENPYVESSRLSLMLATCDLPSGEKGLLAIIGPTRMRYDKNIKLLQALSRAIEEGEDLYE